MRKADPTYVKFIIFIVFVVICVGFEYLIYSTGRLKEKVTFLEWLTTNKSVLVL